MLTNELIKKKAKELGATVCGIGKVYEESNPQRDPKMILPNAKCIIGFGFAVPKGLYKAMDKGAQYYTYTTMGVKYIDEEMAEIFLLKIGGMIENEGYDACLQKAIPNLRIKGDMLGSPLPMWLSALTGQGLKSAVFILVFQQMFSSYPVSLDEAAELDGAGKYKVFFRIALPIAKPSIILSLLFSFVWYWNETRQSGLFFGEVIKTLPMKLGNFAASYADLYSGMGAGTDAAMSINEAVTLAGTMLSCLPILIMFIILQRQFVESIEKSGITGE